nr:hypothetical protein [Tanacetum cinerariifolium]
HPQTHPTHYNQNSSTRSQQAANKNRGKAIVNSPQPIYDQEPSVVNDDDDETSKDKEIHKLMVLISLSFKKIYKPTNNNLRTSSNTNAVDSGPIFDKEPEQKVQNDDHYDVFAIESQHPEQCESVHKTYLIEQDARNVIIESADMHYDSQQIDQNDEDVDLAKEQMKNKLSAHQDTISILKQQKDAQIKLYKSREDKEIEKFIYLENKVKVLDNIVYKTGQTIQTMNMLNNKCRTSFVKPEYLKKAKQTNPRLYDIGCYNDNLALMLSPESDEVIRLEKES